MPNLNRGFPDFVCSCMNSKSLFLKHIIQAAKNGADLIKIQTYEAKDITIKNIKVGKLNLWDLYSKAKTPLSWHKEAFKLAQKLHITLFSTPFSLRAVQILEKLNVKLYKISSFEITDLLLIDAEGMDVEIAKAENMSL